MTSRLRNNRGRTRTLEDECTQSVKVDFGGEQPPQQSSSTVLEVPAVVSPVESDPVSCSSAPCDTMPISPTTASLNSAAPVPVPIAELAPRDNVAPRPPAWLQNKMMTSGVEEPEPTEWSEMVAAVVQMGKSATTTLREWLIEQGATQAGAFTDKGVTHVFTDSKVKADGIVAKLDLLKRCVKVVIVVPEGTKPGSRSRAQEKRPRKKEQQKSEDRGNGAFMLPALNGHTRCSERDLVPSHLCVILSQVRSQICRGSWAGSGQDLLMYPHSPRRRRTLMMRAQVASHCRALPRDSHAPAATTSICRAACGRECGG